MPEMTVTVRWPGGQVDDLYSPSLVMHDYLNTGSAYTVQDFVARSTEALTLASERVQARFGYFCSSAADTSTRIKSRAATFTDDQLVEVLNMTPDLPSQER
ncbi:MSMEG_0570 family nitrogen starvation response protein [Nocardioides cavernaquae]|uniref:MSMEG_0570 family nitrogen starvation response protein n=1 Tax=Nocardioides cavernaquae TaxID=2321396 RepID=A0A3A5HCD6_9ACTN|nr:MSMEG_0570 family nitrogen starvation response protein [Nocardioides cavernaquae]RJS45710.1 MSMEG_0570 family nitrogen starvation response protein [Nocardioides cavernaquae]